ncbi:MAG: ABC transporter permease [Mycobacteriales bacterium]
MSFLGAAVAPGNPWFSSRYLRDNSGTILTALREHVTLTVLTILIGFVIAMPLALLARRYRILATPILSVAGLLYTVPSLALFSILVPFTGLSQRTVIIGLVMYALLILIRNILTGLEGVPAEVRDAARGMGYSPALMLLRVDLPIALPAIMAGIRIATVSTIALVTVGATVGYGGFGALIINGFNNNFYRAEIATGALACVALALLADVLLLGIARVLSPWARSRAQ